MDWDHRVKEHFFFPPHARITMEDFWERMHPDDRAATSAALDASIRDRHELRNPLAPIRTGLSILRAGGNPEQQARTRDMMERQLRQVVHLVDDLFDISRISLGKVTLRKERVDFRAVLHSAAETTRALMDRKRHSFVVRLPEEPLPIEGDAARLTQVVANLLNNAAKYTPDGGHIELSATVEQDRLVIRVVDNGIGIPTHMLPRVFDLFTQVEGSSEQGQGGLGIGLTLVRGLVELHDGSVLAESAGPGMGTTLIVNLPLSAREQRASSDSQDEHLAVGARRILVVDDNADAAASLAMLLELDGHLAQVAHDGAGAIEAVGRFAPHVVLLDIGRTGWGSDEDRRQTGLAGFDAHLVKPVDLAELRTALL